MFHGQQRPDLAQTPCWASKYHFAICSNPLLDRHKPGGSKGDLHSRSLIQHICWVLCWPTSVDLSGFCYFLRPMSAMPPHLASPEAYQFALHILIENLTNRRASRPRQVKDTMQIDLPSGNSLGLWSANVWCHLVALISVITGKLHPRGPTCALR